VFWFIRFPSPSCSSSRRDKQSRATAARRAGRSLPPRLDPSRQSLPRLALCLLQVVLSSATIAVPAELRPSPSSSLSRPFSAQIEPTVSSAATSSPSPTSCPFDFRAATTGNVPRRRRPPCSRRRTPRAEPARLRAAPPRALTPRPRWSLLRPAMPPPSLALAATTAPPPRRPAPVSAPPRAAARPLLYASPRAAGRPVPPAAPGRGSAQPRRWPATAGRAAAGCSGQSAPVLARAGEAGEWGGAAGPAPTAMWGPAVSPPLFYFFLSIISAGNS